MVEALLRIMILPGNQYVSAVRTDSTTLGVLDVWHSFITCTETYCRK